MGKKESDASRAQFSARREDERPTIVGGRPPEKLSRQHSFSRGIEKVVWLAALDRDFCRLLLGDRKAALEDPRVELTGAERMILSNIADAQLMSVIERVSIPRRARRAFLRGAVATAFALMGTVVVSSGCTLGSRPPEPEHLDEAVAKSRLREIWMAQERYRDEHGKYARSIKLLVDSGCLEERDRDKLRGFDFDVINITEDSFEAYATSRGRLPTFSVDETGVVREVQAFRAEEGG